MDIVADDAIVLLDETFARHGRVTRVPGREIGPCDVRQADVLLLRSVTRADQALLRGSRVRFVGTATIGTDHLDTAWLEDNGIEWASAPGCNADAAAQYSLAMAWCACRRAGMPFSELRAGIIGRGNVGSRLQRLLQMLGIPAVACDPPLAAAGLAGLVSQEEALDQTLVSLHVPLTRDGPCPTYRMLNRETLSRLPDGALLVNTSRGDVTDGGALLDELGSGRILAALDVWPGEPDIDPRLLAKTLVATPHVAGYSVEGKRNGTLMIYRAFCQWARLEPRKPASAGKRQKPVNPDGLLERVREAGAGVEADDRNMRDALDAAPSIASAFERLRKTYCLRRDFGRVTV
jgi:erythronate-4-phosphate dehydrogenase